ncbi:MAG: hypothetical protein L0J63_01110 [Tetragenococcus koreensis]|nr:hypothetical protein [Tetragenococcus koreensis]
MTAIVMAIILLTIAVIGLTVTTWLQNEEIERIKSKITVSGWHAASRKTSVIEELKKEGFLDDKKEQ